ncbi:SDR family NAD(P)-dependent oxidoreductase [Paenibacillus sp. BC26]|uniref:SDR family NAD(P)-dependent oxidoreductase n=1 Tax=Paenibacillus sp. BC26 TaxID=1881032 RepID=UPI0008E50097|nr:SDR family oxidoreductase [Paenibacillus sp. BC26]SFS55441.1 3-oxoacyl-[acyl-carrier protein] reductase [Paenibacillus sp. BC26]
MKSLHNKTAIITGSTSGIGEATAYKLAELGAKVLVTGRDPERGSKVAAEIIGQGGEALFVQADLSDPSVPGKLVQAAISQWGRLDIVVNNAALVCSKPLAEVTHQDWDRLFAVNVKAGFFLIQAALPYLRETQGAVVNVSSINGEINAHDNLVYDTMKAALNHMTRGLAFELRKEGVRFNALLPAGVATPLLEQWLQQKLGDPEAAKQAADRSYDDPRVGKPEQIASAVAFLVSQESSWVNGALIPIEGGFTLGNTKD